MSTEANSGSSTSNRLSGLPGSCPVGSRSVQINPSPLERPVDMPRGEGGVGFAHQLVDVIKRRLPFRALLLSPIKISELVWVMQGRFDLEVSAATDQRAAADQQLGEDRDRVGLGVRSDLLDDRAGQPVERVGGGRLRARPPGRGA